MDDDLQRALAEMQAARNDLSAVVRALPKEALGRARPGGWTVGRVLQHVIESEAVYTKLLAHLCARTAPELDVREPATGADTLALLAATRAAVEAMVDGVDAETLYRLARLGHDEYSPLSVLENIASHDRDHIGQIGGLLQEERASSAGAFAGLIRPARVGDLPRLTEIYNHYVANTAITFDLEPYSAEQRRPWFAQFAETGPHRLFVAEDGGAVLGYAGTHQFRTKAAYDTTIETTVYCAPEATGRGLGRALYGALFDALRGEDLHVAIAGITLPNEASVALHARFGFEPAGVMREVGRKFGRYWDVQWMVRRL